MPTSKIAVVGDRDSILGFKTLGVATFPAADAERALQIFRQLVAENYGVIFVTEDLARDLQEPIAELNRRFLPAVIPIPSSRGALGIGMEAIRKNLEKAIGADIFSRKEG
ncbi:MAG TPA: V-type ATP synthase subunit F [Bacillota bacterium]|jgi:V/A-type H+-transporting ATPase subunit F|nr:V-type ATP synthase subunit F [Bacillota bacterium]HOA34697.1 V-type ATP synthase subunit F [Bacillota bacterium]HOL14958.1 V-type ATP synthase subunit F [Bacillota bacterium]HPZ11164.1 V-type ATP synthase subunit F [Bacillota bacterium]HQE09238.1 V-type ATP synthase subunit F [Bacillota bacterium]